MPPQPRAQNKYRGLKQLVQQKFYRKTKPRSKFRNPKIIRKVQNGFLISFFSCISRHSTTVSLYFNFYFTTSTPKNCKGVITGCPITTMVDDHLTLYTKHYLCRGQFKNSFSCLLAYYCTCIYF